MWLFSQYIVHNMILEYFLLFSCFKYLSILVAQGHMISEGHIRSEGHMRSEGQ